MNERIAPKGYEYITGEIRIDKPLSIYIWDGIRTEWVPKSQIEDPEEFEIGETIELLIPLWLAEQKGFI